MSLGKSSHGKARCGFGVAGPGAVRRGPQWGENFWIGMARRAWVGYG